MKTAQGLVNYAEAQLGNPYWWGGYGLIASQTLLNQMKSLYPAVYNTEYYSDAPSQFGKRVFDCVGLIKGYRWSEAPNTNPVYVPSQDVAVPGLYNQCQSKGPISSMLDKPGICVFIGSSHVGVYVGDGYVIEAKSHADGVIKTKLKDRGWTNWGAPAWIDYSSQLEPDTNYVNWFGMLKEKDQQTVSKWPNIQKGNKGGYVGALQMLLQFYGGYKIDVDGDFGSQTKEKVKRWQQNHSLEPDGVCGKQTWASFFVSE